VLVVHPASGYQEKRLYLSASLSSGVDFECDWCFIPKLFYSFTAWSLFTGLLYLYVTLVTEHFDLYPSFVFVRFVLQMSV
jgi:hypothetical protein